MLTDKEFEMWATGLGLSERATGLVKAIRGTDPARRPRSGPRNVAGRYPSRKMARTIAYESRTVELRAIHGYEHDPLVLEFWDQPWMFKLRYRAPEKGFVGTFHTPDFLVLHREEAVFEEWKTVEGLERLAAKPNQHRYQRDDDGVWVSRPAEEAAREYGLGYRIRTSSELSTTVNTNLEFLSGYFDEEELDPLRSERILTVVGAHPGVTLDELVGEVE